MSSGLICEERAGSLLVSVDRPPANALDLALTEELADLFEALAARTDLKSLVLTGRGGSFCAGLDLKQVPAYGAAEQDRLLDALNRAFYGAYRLPVPVVAAINGHAIAGGLVLALCGDLRLAADTDSLLGVTEVRAGIPYPVGAIEVCRQEMAPAVFRRRVLFGETLSPREALAEGLIDRLTAPETLIDDALEAAATLRRAPSDGYGKIKRQSRMPALRRMREAIEEGNEPLRGDWLSDETQAAARALLGGGGG